MEYFATIGPKCRTKEIFLDMLGEGMTGMRLNLSHTSLALSRPVTEAYREACREAGVPAELLIDLHGPEMRTGSFPDMHLAEGDTVRLQAGKEARGQGILPVPAAFLEALRRGDTVLVHDGVLRLRAEERDGDGFAARVLRAGTACARQSLRIEGREVMGETVTEEDLENLDLAEECGVKSVMQPFVRGRGDVLAVRRALRERNLSLRIMAKIESREGLKNLREIAREADMVVIARGDLGNAVPLETLPACQMAAARVCREEGTPFMVVTELLQSMVHSPSPTRAEVSDIFRSVLDGAGALMVTGETAVGDYPREVMRSLVRTARAAQACLAKSNFTDDYLETL